MGLFDNVSDGINLFDLLGFGVYIRNIGFFLNAALDISNNGLKQLMLIKTGIFGQI